MKFQLQRSRCAAHLVHLVQLASLMLLSACAVGPDYVRPSAETPAAFKELAGWKMAQPADLALPAKWWEIYQDPLLNTLEEAANLSNQSLIQAEAQYRQARALVQASRAAYFPTVAANVSQTRAGGLASSNRSTTGAPSSTNLLAIDATWEPDLWGRVRRSVEASEANAQASAALLQATRLSIEALLAQNYFQLRSLDADRQLYDKTVADYRKSLELTQNQYAAGIVPKGTVVLALTQLKSTQAQAIDFDVLRAQMEHAIALLVGKPPAHFAIAPGRFDTRVPLLPQAIPSALLERRPDVANAERLVAAANAQIGVAQAAYFPSLTLAASGGYQASALANWISLPNRLWSVGPALAQTLFEGGARQAQSEQAIAAYDAGVANYRHTVLTSFQEVEDNLAALRILEQEAQEQDEAVRLSRRSVELMLNQYKAGTVTYLDVITVEASALSNERTAVDLRNRRLSASVLLIKALGGGWNAAQLREAGVPGKRD